VILINFLENKSRPCLVLLSLTLIILIAVIDTQVPVEVFLSIFYLDVDNFKVINDQFSYTVGDHLLQLVAQTIKEQLRQSDVVARLGGDEFAILLPETDYDAAAIALRRIQAILLSLMQQHDWPATFSIGAVTFTRSPSSVEFMLEQADRLMYSSKHRGKNRLHHQVLDSVVSVL
jgi:diguanylate cyclase (GGDEF)-like protein